MCFINPTNQLVCGILLKAQGWGARNDHRLFIKVDESPPASIVVPFFPINGSEKGRGQMLPKFFKHYLGSSLDRSMTLPSPTG